jgi:flavorubredoxin
MPITLPASPHLVADETWIIPTFSAIPDGSWVPAHSLLIRGAEPVIVDTGSALLRDQWLRDLTSLVEPADVRWIFLSHDDHDHAGNLQAVLELCPNATLVASFAIVGRLAPEQDLPLDRMRWIDPGGSFSAGDRTLRLVRPPMFDSPATRGLVDESTGMLWAVDSFGSLAPGAVFERDDVPDDLFDASFVALNAWNTPWIEWVDVERYRSHVETTRALPLEVVASAHGPVLRGGQIDDAFARTLAMAARPVPPMPGQDTLDELLAGLAAVPELVG